MNDKTDIAYTRDGDIILSITKDEDGNELKDLSLVGGHEELEQFALFRLKTKLGELLLHPSVGNKLEDIIGRRNTRETAEEGKNYIRSAILMNSHIDPASLTVTAVPISEYKISYIIEIDSTPYAGINMVLEVDLQSGVRRIV
jgi:hypothetical protein